MNYTKFKLKPVDELLNVLKDRNSIFVFSCRKCFKEFTDEREFNYSELFQAFSKASKQVVGCTELDFLCNEYLTRKKIAQINLSDVDAIGVVSCGIGIQLVAEIIQSKPVYAFSDSQRCGNATVSVAYHGIALSDKQCAACGQCYLNISGGVCPIVDCSKSLLNGPCGGAKDGKCEVKLADGSTKDCAWEKIVKKLGMSVFYNQNLSQVPRVSNSIDREFVQLRDYSIPEYEFVSKHIIENISRRTEGFYGGVYPFENKYFTEDKPIETFPEPEFVVIPLLQHTGAICQPQVKVGEQVKYGEMIGDNQSLVSAPIHSSVSGKVVAIEEKMHPIVTPSVGKKVLSVVIKNDFKNTPDGSIKPIENFESLTQKQLLEIIREKGIVGLGGAAFPTHVKLQPPKPVDTLLINGCECEPYLTCDYRMMIEHSNEILTGMRILLKILDIEKAIVAIEDNKQRKSHTNIDVEIVTVKTKYP
ncbi:MAG: methylenetetrahydrofolate reductase C-terminal domain-containing protein, partial [Elusimicrobiota bacterium]|nr:methylenetetrahydrofolate reductase C-terminal domain-containing protein [Elusimicrobiota bacterium]